MDTVLVAHDGSALADRAVSFAAELARPTSARIVLLHALPSGSAAEGTTPEESLVDPAADALDTAAARLAVAGCPVERRCPRGHPAARCTPRRPLCPWNHPSGSKD